MLRFCLTFAVVLGLAVPALAAPPSPDPKSLVVPPEELSKARELVQKLGSEIFTEREESQRALADMGRLARQALLDGANTDPDPEIRLRCKTLLPKATAAEMKARLDSFLADTENKYDHDLPGWHKLRATVRGEWKMFGWTYTSHPKADKAARELFIEFINAPGGRKLFTSLDAPPGELGQLVGARKYELYYLRYPRVSGLPARTPSVAEVAGVLFAESQVDSRHVPRTIAITTLLSLSGLNTAINGSDPRSVALRAVVVGWFDSRTDAADLYSAMTMSRTTMPELTPRLAARLLNAPGALGTYRGMAITTLVQLKAKDQIPLIEKALTDESVLTTVAVAVGGKIERHTIQVRDAALAACVLLTEQKLDDYGFEDPYKGTGAQPTTFTYTRAKLSDEKRKEALEKWKVWREKNP